MINKENTLKFFSDEDKSVVANILDKIQLAYNRDIPVFTKEFITPNIWNFFVKTNFNIKIEADGFFEDSERRVLSINNLYNSNFPIVTIKIENKSNFSTLGHRDYLGSVLALGIEREKIGDIVVKDSCAYLVCMEDISDYIIYNLQTIGRSKVSVSVIEDIEDMPNIELEEQIINISSLRLDSVVAKLGNTSRAKSIDYILGSKVMVDYITTKDKSLELKENMRLTIRGVGKFIIGSVVGETKSGKIKIIVKKYC